MYNVFFGLNLECGVVLIVWKNWICCLKILYVVVEVGSVFVEIYNFFGLYVREGRLVCCIVCGIL